MAEVTNLSQRRIVEGTLRLLARRGLRKLSMTDIASEAGVSRGTLYRYFTGVDEVLEGLERELEQTLDDLLEEAAGEGGRCSPEVLVQTLSRFGTKHPVMGVLVREQPGLVRDYLVRRFDVLLELLGRHLAPAGRGGVPEREMAEVLLRLLVAYLLVPTAGAGHLAAEDLMGFLTVGSATASAAKARPRSARRAG